MRAGLAGSVASYLFSHSLAIGAGASGAIFGIMGALAAFFAIQRDVLGTMGQRNLTAVLVLAGLNLLYGLLTPGIDNWAHLGGVIGGVVLGLGLAPHLIVMMSPLGFPERLKNVSPISKRWWVIPVALLVLAAGVWLGTETLPDNTYTHLYRSEMYQRQNKLDLALQEVNYALEVDQMSGDAYLRRGLVYIEIGDSVNARADFLNAFKYGGAQTKSDALDLLHLMDSGQLQ